MQLNLYLQTQVIKAATFARKIDMSEGQVHKYLWANAIPLLPAAHKIFKATDERVTPNDFYKIVFTNPDNEQLCVRCTNKIALSNYSKPQEIIFEDYKIKN